MLTGDGWLEAERAFGANPGEVVEISYAVDGEVTTETFDPVDHYRLEVEGFAEAVEAGTEPRITREDTVGNMRAIDALAESAASGEPVDLE